MNNFIAKSIILVAVLRIGKLLLVESVNKSFKFKQVKRDDTIRWINY